MILSPVANSCINSSAQGEKYDSSTINIANGTCTDG